MRKLTTKEWIAKAIKVHGEKYGYDRSFYIESYKKIKIFCKFHRRYFYQMAIDHTQGFGCPKCGTLLVAEKLSQKSRAEFIAKSIAIHGEIYDYSGVIYKNALTKVKIFCRKHGKIFDQKPNAHLNGQGCPDCGNERTSASFRKTNKDFINEIKKLYGNKFDLSKVDYRTSKIKIILFCNDHRIEFTQTPDGLLRGPGCNKCRSEVKRKNTLGFRAKYLSKSERKKICSLYYLRFKFGGRFFFKIGISKNLKSRLTYLKYQSGLKFDVLYTFETNRYRALKIEEKIIKNFKDFRIEPNIMFNGNTECFEMDILGLAS